MKKYLYEGRSARARHGCARAALIASALFFLAGCGLFAYTFLVQKENGAAMNTTTQPNMRAYDGKLEWFDGASWSPVSTLEAFLQSDPLKGGPKASVSVASEGAGSAGDAAGGQAAPAANENDGAVERKEGTITAPASRPRQSAADNGAPTAPSQSSNSSSSSDSGGSSGSSGGSGSGGSTESGGSSGSDGDGQDTSADYL